MNHAQEPTQPDLLPTPRPEIDRHHLAFDHEKGYVARITLNREHQKLVGERIKIPLNTRDEAEAAARRDLVFKVFEKIRVPIRDRRQRRPGNGGRRKGG
jgi:hypothetical protein